jgi:hypothetical protein
VVGRNACRGVLYGRILPVIFPSGHYWFSLDSVRKQEPVGTGDCEAEIVGMGSGSPGRSP